MSKSRLYYIDRLRVFLTILVILHHTSIAFGGEGGWYYVVVTGDELTPTKALLTLFTGVNQAFFMGFFFLISGYFTPGAFDRKGAGRFLADRFIRLGIPLIAYLAVIGPVLIYRLNEADSMSFWTFYLNEVLTLKVLNFGPLWFVEALLYFALIYAGYRWVSKCSDTGSNTRSSSSSSADASSNSFPSNRTLLLSALGVGLAAFVLRLFFPTGWDVLGLQLGYFASYILLFAVGAMAYRRGWLERIPDRTAKIWGRISAASIPVLPIAIVSYEALGWGPADDLNGGWNALALLYAFWEPFVAFGIIMRLLCLFKKRFNQQSRIGQLMADSAFTAFIIHAPIVVMVSYLCKDTGFPALVNFALAGTAATVCSFTLGWLIRSIPGMKRVL